MTELRAATDVLAESVGLAGLDAIDVGCGGGELVRWMRAQGATVNGAECGRKMRAQAIAADPDHAGAYVDAGGQSLPFADGSFDLVVYSYSLHHVPVSDIAAALMEAHRVLRPGATLYVVEPEPISPDNAVAYPVVDERVELAAAQAALDEAARSRFRESARIEYESEGTYPSFDDWAAMMVGIDPTRAALMDEHRGQLHEQFHTMGAAVEGGYTFRRGNVVRILLAR